MFPLVRVGEGGRGGTPLLKVVLSVLAERTAFGEVYKLSFYFYLAVRTCWHRPGFFGGI